MKTIEDCLERLDHIINAFYYGSNTSVPHPSTKVNDWDKRFISDVSTHTAKGSSLSTKQSEIVLKLLARYKRLFATHEQPIVDKLLENPVYRRELYTSMEIPREVRWAGGSTFLFRFNYNVAIQADIRNLQSELESIIVPNRIPDLKVWRIIVDASNIKTVMNFIRIHNFQFDDEVLHQFFEIQNNMSNPNIVRTTEDSIEVEINNDVLAALWLDDMEDLRDA